MVHTVQWDILLTSDFFHFDDRTPGDQHRHTPSYRAPWWLQLVRNIDLWNKFTAITIFCHSYSAEIDFRIRRLQTSDSDD